MTERWQHELRKLGLIDPPVPETPSRRRETDMPVAARPTGRLVAGIVAFAVFAAGASVAWLAFGSSGSTTLSGRSAAPEAHVTQTPPPSVAGAVWTFGGAPGWRVSQGRITPNQEVASAWTANVQFDRRDLPNETGFPLHTVAELPTNGIVATVLGDAPGRRHHSPGPQGRVLSLPPQLSDATVRPPEAEEPSGNLVVYELSGYTDHGFVLIRVYFGSKNPPPSQLAQAQAALNRLEYRSA